MTNSFLPNIFYSLTEEGFVPDILLASQRFGLNRTVRKRYPVQCLPVYSLLLALGNPTVDFFSLDVEGAEIRVLKTIPFDKVDIRLGNKIPEHTRNPYIVSVS